MTGSDTSPGSRHLPSGVHHAVRPGSALLRLETTASREGVLDGAWWPRSRDIGAELPALLSALTEHLGPLTRVGLDATAWEGLPTRIVVGDRVVHVGSFPVSDDTVLISRGEGGPLLAAGGPTGHASRGRPRGDGTGCPGRQRQRGGADPHRHGKRAEAVRLTFVVAGGAVSRATPPGAASRRPSCVRPAPA